MEMIGCRHRSRLVHGHHVGLLADDQAVLELPAPTRQAGDDLRPLRPTPAAQAQEDSGHGLTLCQLGRPACGHAGTPDQEERGRRVAPSSLVAAERQFSGTFLPSLYMYSVMAGFLSSPSASKAMLAVTPL